jgi:hypothetical protein
MVTLFLFYELKISYKKCKFIQKINNCIKKMCKRLHFFKKIIDNLSLGYYTK